MNGGTCIDCGTPGRRLEWSADDFPLSRCIGCGLVYKSTWDSELAGTDFHEGNVAYYERMEANAHELAITHANVQRMSEVLSRLARYAPARTLLDVGCGRGEAVGLAAAQGWHARGIDLAPGAIRIARSRGYNCDVINVFSPDLDHQQYGVIVMSEFIEHVPQPRRFIDRAAALLSPGGVLYLTTPNFNALGRRVLGPSWNAFFEGHVSFFTPRRLAAAVAAAGFDVIDIQTTGVSVAAAAQFFRRRPGPVPSRAAQESTTAATREALYRSPWGRALKRAVDPLISSTRLGETVKVTARLRS